MNSIEEVYHEIIDKALHEVDFARAVFMQKDDSDDRDWRIDKFDSILNLLETVREFL